jgi:hypothetical protein
MPFVGTISPPGSLFTELKSCWLKRKWPVREVLITRKLAITYGNNDSGVNHPVPDRRAGDFFIVKGINHMRDCRGEADAQEDAGLPGKSTCRGRTAADVVLLTENRDLLKKDQA